MEALAQKLHLDESTDPCCNLSLKRVYRWVFLLLVVEQSLALTFLLGFDPWPEPWGHFVFQVIVDIFFIWNLVFHVWRKGIIRAAEVRRYEERMHQLRQQSGKLVLVGNKRKASTGLGKKKSAFASAMVIVGEDRPKGPYYNSVQFVADVCGAIPFSCILFAMAMTVATASELEGGVYIAVQVLHWLALVRLLQLERVWAWLQRLRKSVSFSGSAVTFVSLATFWLGFVHLSSCIFFLISQYEIRIDPSSQTWVTQNTVGMQPGQSFQNSTLPVQYFVTFYLLALTLIGQPPDIFTITETLYMLMVVMMGFVVLMSVLLGVFVNVVGLLQARRNDVELALERIKSLSKKLHLEEKTRRLILNVWSGVGKSDKHFDLTIETHGDMMKPLPFNIKAMVVNDVMAYLREEADMSVRTNRAWYSLVTVLQRNHMRFLVDLFCTMSLVHVCSGDDLVTKGHIADAFFILQDGALEVLDSKDERAIVILLSGAIVGIAAFSSSVTERRSSTVRAKGLCRLWRVDRKSFHKLTQRFVAEEELFDEFFMFVREVQTAENATGGRLIGLVSTALHTVGSLENLNAAKDNTAVPPPADMEMERVSDGEGSDLSLGEGVLL